MEPEEVSLTDMWKRDQVGDRFMSLMDMFGRYAKYFDIHSFKMLDEKNRVMDELEKGIPFREIPGAMDILEGMRRLG